MLRRLINCRIIIIIIIMHVAEIESEPSRRLSQCKRKYNQRIKWSHLVITSRWQNVKNALEYRTHSACKTCSLKHIIKINTLCKALH